jgi:hypothetical protein
VSAFVLLAVLQVAGTQPQLATPPAGTGSQFRVQLGSRIAPDTVTVGQRFIVFLKVRAPRGALVQFPAGVDSAVASASATAPQVIGAPFLDSIPDAAGTTRTAAYRFTAWDVGQQRLGLGNIAVTLNRRTEYVSLADQSVFVRSVLPADTTQRQPKPPRPPIVLAPFNWWPWILLLLAILAALLAWWLWRIWRRRRNAPLPPFETAEREFARIEAMHLIESGQPERYVALMTDVLRVYLAARVEGILRSHTTPELVAASAPVQSVTIGLDRLLGHADLVKFARQRVTPSDAQTIGAHARSIVSQVETHLVALEREKTEKRAA